MQVVPVNNGIIERHAVFQLRKGVSHLNNYLRDLLEERGYYFQTAAEMEEVRRIKEKFCYIPASYDKEMRRPEAEISVTFRRDSGDLISIGRERFKCPELLFNPLKVGILDAQFALPQVIVEAVMKCPIDTRVNLLSNIMLVGGGTLIPGMFFSPPPPSSPLPPPPASFLP
jgi:actin-related protein